MDTNREEIAELSDDEKKRIEIFVETHVKILSASYDKAVAYTNLLIVAGYASLFALWHSTKDHLGRRQVLSTAILLLISVAVFVLFEVYKAYYTGTMLRGYNEIVNDPKNQGSLERMVSEINAYKIRDQKRGLTFIKSWVIVFFVTTLTGLGAALILLYAFVRSLLAS